MVDKNKQLFHGCIDVEKREKGYLAKRFTPKQFERYTKMPWCIYPYCTAGVFMEFVTAAEEISFDYYFSQSSIFLRMTRIWHLSKNLTVPRAGILHIGRRRQEPFACGFIFRIREKRIFPI